MTENSTETTEVADTPSATPEGDVSDATPEGDQTVDTPEPDTFPREYVERLRTENGRYRQRAGEADSLSKRLHTELVRATGRLADPTDLPFDPEHLDDPEKLSNALDDLIGRKPHLAARRITGDIGQGAQGDTGTVSLIDILRGTTG